MGTDAVLALDAGTSSAKALLVDLDGGAVLARESAPVRLRTQAPGWVEQDANELADAVISAGATACAARPDVSVRAIALSNQRESVVAWDAATGVPVGPLLSWQDARTADWVSSLPLDVAADVREKSGLTLDAMYSAPKMRWLLDNADRPRSSLRLGTVDSWLVHRITGDWAIESGNASRTLLLDIASGDWDLELLDAFGIPRSALPDVRHSDADFGTTRAVAGLPDGVPVVAVLADSHAALFAHASRGDGIAKATYGTGTSVMVPLADATARIPGLDTTIAWWTDAPNYALEGNILATGQAIDWIAQIVGGDDVQAGGRIVAELAARVPDAGGATLVPAFTGLGSPYWDRRAVATLSGMTASTTREHLARAALESVAHQVADIVDAVRGEKDGRIERLHADGGASSIDALLAVQADLLGLPVVRSQEAALSALGAARMAARRLGRPLPPIDLDPPIEPHLPATARQGQRDAWRRAIDRSRFAPDAPDLEEDA